MTGPRSAGPRSAGATRGGRGVERAPAARELGVSNTPAVLFAATSRRAVDGMFKIVYVLEQQTEILEHLHRGTKTQTQIPKFGKDCFGIGCVGKHVLA
jgi:hypothetical protein